MTALEFAFEYAEKQAAAFGGTGKSGNEAFKLSNRPRRQNLDETILKVGDKFTIPADENDKAWWAAPLQRAPQGSTPNDVLRCIVEVSNGNAPKVAKSIFLGSLFKNIRDVDGKIHTASVKVGSKDGQDFDVSECVTDEAVWRKLFGKTITVVNESPTINYIRRGFNGQPDRASTTTVLTFVVE